MTIRRRMAELLKQGRYTSRDISQLLRISEKEVCEHLPHVERSLGPGADIIAEPSRCVKCGFVFTKRKRFTSPARCPVCKSESVTYPVFGLTEEG